MSRLPLPQYAIWHGDVLRAAGRSARGSPRLRARRRDRRIQRANGVRTELQTALFDLDRGRRLADALARARAEYARAPSIEAADVLAWALERNGRCGEALDYSRRALRLGTRDALKLFHRGMIERCLGHDAGARDWFGRALEANPHFSLALGAGREAVRGMRRLVASVVAAAGLALLATAPAFAHPLGNFSVNHLTEVSVSQDRVELRYLLDQAEIPTVEERGLSDAAVLEGKRDEVLERLVLVVDGKRVPLRIDGQGRLSHPPGVGGLETTRAELRLSARVSDPDRVEVRDGTFPGRVGWKAVVSAPGKGPRCGPTPRAATPPVACAATRKTC